MKVFVWAALGSPVSNAILVVLSELRCALCVVVEQISITIWGIALG